MEPGDQAGPARAREPIREAGTVRESVTIWYRGAGYQLGRGERGYAIWPAGGPPGQPLEQWPETPAGWAAAWSRFNTVEARGTIVHLQSPVEPGPAGPAGPASPGMSAAPPGVPAAPPGAPYAWPGARPGSPGARPGWAGVRSRGALTAAILLVTGVALGLAGLFPAYLSGSSLAQQPAELVPHVIYLAAWTASALLIASGGIRLRIGALLALGMSVVTFGFFFADLGTVIAGGGRLMGPGLLLGLAGWLACTAGAVLAFRLRAADAPRKLERRPAGPVVTLALAVLAAVGAAIAFAPSWDSYTLQSASGATQTLTAGNSFANPGPVIVGDVAVMVTLVAVVVVAALWRPARLGAVLLAGAAIPMAAQAISAIVQVTEPVSAASFGISPAQAAQAGLTISAGLTPVFWVYCAFVVALLLAGGWMFMPRRPPGQAGIRPGGVAAPVPGTVTTWSS
jgi:hypothetical protein